MKKLSIIIPIYNVERYLAECLDSVIAQTYDHSQIECILVNDCTPDNSMEIVREKVEKYREEGGSMTFKIVTHEVNSGLSAARNSGMEQATGEFLLFVDSDDYLYPESIHTFMMHREKFPEADLLIGNHYEEGRQVNRFKFKSPYKVVRDTNLLYVGDLCKWTAWNYCVRRSVVETHRLRFETGIYFEDNVFNDSLMSIVNYAVIFTEVTYFYRKNDNGIIQKMSREKTDKCVNDYLKIFSFMLSRLGGRCYVGKSMKLFVLLMYFCDYINRHGDMVKDVENRKKELERNKKTLIRTNLSHGRLFLFLLSLLLVNPFHGLTRLYFMRRYFDHIIALFWRPELVMNHILPFR